MRHTIENEGINRLAEDALFYTGERQEQLARRQQLEKSISGLEEAGRIERLRLVVHLEECKQATRAAAEDLERFDEIDAQRSGVHAEILQLLVDEEQLEDEAARCISTDAAGVGFAYARTELLEPGGVKALVDRRRLRRAGATQREAEAV